MSRHDSLALLVEGRRRETFARWSNGKGAVAEMRHRSFQDRPPRKAEPVGAAPAGGARHPALGRLRDPTGGHYDPSARSLAGLGAVQ